MCDHNRLLVPKSGPGSAELPHLLEQESEGLCYVFAVAFRLLGVSWPRTGTTNAAVISSGTHFDAAPRPTTTAASASATTLWPDRHAFEPEAEPLDSSGSGGSGGGGGRGQTRQSQQQQQRRLLRPPRPRTASGSAGSGGGRWGGGGARGLRQGEGVGGVVPLTATLVVDDLLEWSGEGDEGPSERRGGDPGADGGERGRTGGGVAPGGGGGREMEVEVVAYASWDGTALGREYLCREGAALLRRYFVADGEVQRGR